MKTTPDELVRQLATVIELGFAKDAVGSYVEMQQRFLAGDWQPAELDGGRLCEVVSRALLQLDLGKVTHSELPKVIRDQLLDSKNPSHLLPPQDRKHIAQVIELVYKFRSDRGAVHISPIHDANYMDSMLVLHAGKWMLAELIRLALKHDTKAVGEIVAQLVQLDHSLIHELDGRPMVMAKSISIPDEVLLLVNHAPNNRLRRSEIKSLVVNRSPASVSNAITQLIKTKELRKADGDEVALTPIGQIRVMKVILPTHTPA